jgi:putative sterol carrier protein
MVGHMDDELKALIENAIKKFNQKAASDEKLQKQLKGMDRKVLLEFHDTDPAHFHLCDMCIKDFGDGPIEDFNLRVISDQETLKGLLKQEIKPMKAYAMGKIKFKGSLTDLLTLKKLFSE